MKRAETPEQAREIAAKIERDMHAAAGVALRVTKLAVRLTITPKIELAKKFIRAILDEE